MGALGTRAWCGINNHLVVKSSLCTNCYQTLNTEPFWVLCLISSYACNLEACQCTVGESIHSLRLRSGVGPPYSYLPSYFVMIHVIQAEKMNKISWDTRKTATFGGFREISCMGPHLTSNNFVYYCLQSTTTHPRLYATPHHKEQATRCWEGPQCHNTRCRLVTTDWS